MREGETLYYIVQYRSGWNLQHGAKARRWLRPNDVATRCASVMPKMEEFAFLGTARVAMKKPLSHEGCTNGAIQGRVCINSLTAVDVRERQVFYELIRHVFTCRIFSVHRVR